MSRPPAWIWDGVGIGIAMAAFLPSSVANPLMPLILAMLCWVRADLIRLDQKIDKKA